MGINYDENRKFEILKIMNLKIYFFGNLVVSQVFSGFFGERESLRFRTEFRDLGNRLRELFGDSLAPLSSQ